MNAASGKVYITGDKHGSLRPFFGLAERGAVKKEDIIIITGDAGYVWDDEYMLKIDTLEQLCPGTIAFIDGNHENHPLLDNLEVSMWNGGRVHRIGDRVLHLMRGEIYTIFGEKYFTFGGARTVSRYVEGVEGIDWFLREEPDADELKSAERVLTDHLEDIDYVITHEAPLMARDHISRVKRGLSGQRSTLSPRPFPGQGKGAALEDISPVAPWEVAQPGQPVKGAKHRRIAAAMPLTGSPSYAMGGAATGDKSGRASVDGTGKTGGNFWSRCSEAVQKHRSDFSGSGVLRKVDSPLSLFTFVKGR